jgi:hypothetical protein
MPRQIQGSQNDFSGGEVDVSLKRADTNQVRKAGCRQLSNFRILNSGAVQNRPGRSAKFPAPGATRTEEVVMSPGNTFYLVFGAGLLQVFNAAGTQVFGTTKKGDGTTTLPWTAATVQNIVWAQAAAANQFSIYICYGDDAPLNVPQVLTWDGVSQTSTWTLSTFAETIAGFQKRTVFYRLSPPNVTMQPSGTVGNITLTFSANFLPAGPAIVGSRMEYCGQQLTITGVTDASHATATVDEVLPLGQQLTYANSQGTIAIGQELIGSATGARGIITAEVTGLITVQVIPGSGGDTVYFSAPEDAVGPNGYVAVTANSTVLPGAVSIWSDEVMNIRNPCSTIRDVLASAISRLFPPESAGRRSACQMISTPRMRHRQPIRCSNWCQENRKCCLFWRAQNHRSSCSATTGFITSRSASPTRSSRDRSPSTC